MDSGSSFPEIEHFLRHIVGIRGSEVNNGLVAHFVPVASPLK